MSNDPKQPNESSPEDFDPAKLLRRIARTRASFTPEQKEMAKALGFDWEPPEGWEPPPEK